MNEDRAYVEQKSAKASRAKRRYGPRGSYGGTTKTTAEVIAEAAEYGKRNSLGCRVRGCRSKMTSSGFCVAHRKVATTGRVPAAMIELPPPVPGLCNWPNKHRSRCRNPHTMRGGLGCPIHKGPPPDADLALP